MKKKRFHMSKLLVPFIVLSIFTFTGIAVWVQLKLGIELSSTLITCFFAFMGSELVAMASIKKTKIKIDANNNGIDDTEEIENAMSDIHNILNNSNNNNEEEMM